MTPSSLHYQQPKPKPEPTEEHRRQPFDVIRYDSVETQLPSKHTHAPYFEYTIQHNVSVSVSVFGDGSRSQRFMRNNKISVLF